MLREWRFRTPILAVLGIFIALFCCALIAFYFWTGGNPWPTIDPYPGVVVRTTEGGVGNWGRWRKQAYMVDLSLDAIQEYYENHMGRRCREEVGFVVSTNCDDTDYDHCRRSAECSIPRPFGEAKLHEQFFSVELYAESENKTWVIQETWWRTP